MNKFTKEQILYLEKHLVFVTAPYSDFMRIRIVGKPEIYGDYFTVDTDIKRPK